jgi:hypothetical protein
MLCRTCADETKGASVAEERLLWKAFDEGYALSNAFSNQKKASAKAISGDLHKTSARNPCRALALLISRIRRNLNQRSIIVAHRAIKARLKADVTSPAVAIHIYEQQHRILITIHAQFPHML